MEMRDGMKENIDDVTFLIPIRIDSLERFENIIAIVNHIYNRFTTNIIILEADVDNNGLLKKKLPEEIKIVFIKDEDLTFHRTKYINNLVAHTSTPFIAVWDADVVVHPKQMLLAVESLRSNGHDFIFPYDGRFTDTGVIYRKIFLESDNINLLEENSSGMFRPYNNSACGGGFFANRDSYIKVGMENENFYGWGPEDGERLRRWRILDMRIGRVNGCMFHLFHPRGLNSTFKSEGDRIKLLNEYNRISAMSKSELEYEISTWIGERKNRLVY